MISSNNYSTNLWLHVFEAKTQRETKGDEMLDSITQLHTGPGRVSLADAARLSGALMKAGDSAHLDVGAVPTLGDLAECLFFSPGDGRIWLNDQRMLLLHSSSFGALRGEVIERLGLEQARGLFTRTGYASGARDARLIRERWPQADAAAVFRAGTHLHTLEGMT